VILETGLVMIVLAIEQWLGIPKEIREWTIGEPSK
jgi:hypothetical protein